MILFPSNQIYRKYTLKKVIFQVTQTKILFPQMGRLLNIRRGCKRIPAIPPLTPRTVHRHLLADRFGGLDNKQLNRLNLTQSTNHFIHNNHVSYIKATVLLKRSKNTLLQTSSRSIDTSISPFSCLQSLRYVAKMERWRKFIINYTSYVELLKRSWSGGGHS